MGRKIKNTKPDLLIIGAGPVGCVIAERAAKIKKWKTLIIEKRNHIAGNCYDEYNSKGVLIHNFSQFPSPSCSIFKSSSILSLPPIHPPQIPIVKTCYPYPFKKMRSNS